MQKANMELILEKCKSITSELLLKKRNLTKLLPEMDFRQIYQDGLIDKDTAINALYILNVIQWKPESKQYLRSWATDTDWKISFISSMLLGNDMTDIMEKFFKSSYILFRSKCLKELDKICPKQ